MTSVIETPERLTAHLRALRACFGAAERIPSSPGGWSAAMYAYDEALVMAADILGVPGAPEPDMVLGRRRLTEPERALLEEGLAERGVDVGVSRSLPRPTGRLLALPPGRPTGDTSATDPPSLGGAWPAEGPADPARQGPADRRLTGRGSELRRLAAEAREVRRRLAGYRASDRTWATKLVEWTADLDAYDDVLLSLAEVAGLPSPVPPGAQRRLLWEDRAALEVELAGAGVELDG